MKNYYDILGIGREATNEQVKTAYRKLSLKFHPDKNNGEEFFSEMFKQINEAYSTLSNDSLRRSYDIKLANFENPPKIIQEQTTKTYPAAAPVKGFKKYTSNSYQSKRSPIVEDEWESVEKWKNRRNIMLGINVVLILIIFITPKQSTESVASSDTTVTKVSPIIHHKHLHHRKRHPQFSQGTNVDSIITSATIAPEVPVKHDTIETLPAISRNNNVSDTLQAVSKKKTHGFFRRLFGKKEDN